MKIAALIPEFVEFIPPKLEKGILYISMIYGTAVHQCCCGCGEKVVTPLSPTDWKLSYDGETVSLHPSIGNWSFACQSHYWVQNNQIRWAEHWSKEKIEAGRNHDKRYKQEYFKVTKNSESNPQRTLGIINKIKDFFFN